jgi:ankyrin repeat protein
LSGIPLALEQAGALIRDGEFTFSAFLEKYRKEYRRLMANHPSQEGLWSSEKKSRAIVTILDMAYRSLEDPGHAALLVFIGTLGSWPIPISFVEEFQFFDTNTAEPSSMSDNLKSLQVVRESSFLRLALRQLARSCLIRLKEEGKRIVSFTIHRMLCQWTLENVTARNHHEYIMQAAYGLAKVIYRGGPETVMLDEQSSLNAGDPVIERRYLAPFIHCLSTIPGHISQSDLDPHTGRFRVPYATVLHQAGWAHLAQGAAENAKNCFHSSIGFETVRLSQAGVEWPEGDGAFGLLCGLSRACQKSGDLSQAVEALESALSLSMRLYGSENNITLALVSRLKATSERQETLQQHHKAVVVASATTFEDSNVRKGVQEASEIASLHSSHEAESRQDLDQEDKAEAEAALIGASYEGDQHMVTLLLSLSNIKIDPKDHCGQTPLSWAARRGYEEVIWLLLEKGADIESKDIGGRTPLSWAVQQGHEEAIQLLLEKGADIESKDNVGRTLLSWAVQQGHEEAIQLLLEKGADIESKDNAGRTPLSWAARRGYEEAIQLLLEKGADIESKDIGGRTPLSWAVQQGYEEAIQLLLEKGADIESKDNEGRTALSWASERGYEIIIGLLL